MITLDGKKNIQITSLQSTLEPPLQILFGRIIFLREIFRWYLIWFLEIIYPSASNTNSSLPLKRFTATGTFTATNARNKERWCPSWRCSWLNYKSVKAPIRASILPSPQGLLHIYINVYIIPCRIPLRSRFRADTVDILNTWYSIISSS